MIDWSTVSETYADAVKSVFPAERFVLAAIGVIGTVTIRAQEYKSVVESILRQPIKDISLSEGSLLARLSLGDFVIAMLLVLAAVLVSYMAKRFVFHLAARSTSLDARMSAFAGTVGTAGGKTADELKSILDLTDRVLSAPRKKLRSLHAAAELSAGLAVGGFVAAVWGNSLDVAIGCMATISLLTLHVLGTRSFLAQYLGPALFRASVLKQPMPSTTKLDA